MAELIFSSMLPASVRGGIAAAVTPVEPRGSPPVELGGEQPGSSTPNAVEAGPPQPAHHVLVG